MTFLTTGNSILDLVIALIIGYSLAWLFVVRPLRGRTEGAESHNYELDTQKRSVQRELTKMRDEGKGLQSKLAASEDALATTRNQLSKAQNEVRAVTEEKIALAADQEVRANLIKELQTQLAAAQEQAIQDKDVADSKLAELQRQLQTTATSTLNTSMEQAQAEKRVLEAKLVAIQTEVVPLKTNLSNLAAENDSLKWRVSAVQAENQLLRTQTSSVLSELETLLWRISPMLRRSQDTSTAGDQWMRNNLSFEANRPILPHLVDQNGDQEVHAGVSE